MAKERPVVAFQGERGAFSEAAAVAYFGEQVQPQAQPAFDRVFAAVEDGSADYGVVPVENSSAGSIHQNYDLLLRHDLAIVGEVQIRIAHHLVVLPGVTLADVRRVYSHPQGLAQCQRNLAHLLPQAEKIPTYDTAGSAKIIREGDIRDAAAIASRRAAEVYQMTILQEGMEDIAENYTRFLVLSRDPIVPEGEAKTSIVFSTKNIPGALFKCLSVFALRDIDLTKIESRPLQDKRWDYFFYIDFAGSIHDPTCRNAMNNLQELTSFFKLLGSYPRNV